jgi:GAF domain-containing protein
MTDTLRSVTLDDVDIKTELSRRPYRPPNYEIENQALGQLAQEMADHPQNILQKLVEIAHKLCRAHTAGVSLLETHNGEAVFRWEALAGLYAPHRNNTMPRNASPCGTTIDRDSTQLMYMAERIYPALKADPPVVEALLIPFHVDGKPVGTVWVVSHDENRKFDAEDDRLVKTLSKFAAAGWQLWKTRVAVEEAAESERRQKVELAKSNEALQHEVNERKRTEGELRQALRDLEESRAQLLEKNAELEDFEKAVVGRELKLIELEKEIETLKRQRS